MVFNLLIFKGLLQFIKNSKKINYFLELAILFDRNQKN